MIPLPEAGDGSRRRRRRRKGGGRRQRPARRLPWSTIAAGAALLLVSVPIVYMAIGLVRGDGDESSGSGTEQAEEVIEPGAASSRSLVVLTDVEGDVVGVTVLAVAASGDGGTIVHVPPGTMVEVPSLGLASLAAAADDGDTELLRSSLENLLGVTFDSSVTLSPRAVQELVEPAGALTVEVDEPVEEQSTSGRITVVFPAGPQPLQPIEIPRFLSAIGSDSQLQRLVRHQAFWTAYLSVVGGSPETVGPSPDIVGGGVAGAVAALSRGDVRHQVLPVEAVSGTSGAEELYRVQDEELVAMVRRLFPDATPSTASGERIRVQVLNGVGTPGLAQRVAPLLVPAGAQVTLSDNADRFDYAVTQVVYYDDDRLADAQAVRDALGVGELVKSLAGLEVVDVTVVVGADFLEEHPGSNPAPSSEGAAP